MRTLEAAGGGGDYVQPVYHTSGYYNYGVPMSSNKVKRTTPSKFLNPDEKIKVCVRKRPLNRKERQQDKNDIIHVQSKDSCVIVNEPKLALNLKSFTQQHVFFFDEAFDENVTNEQLYQKTARPLVQNVLKGANATCFAYGQTGAGKTHSMLGNRHVTGLYMLASRDIFSALHARQSHLQLWISYYEIYRGQLFDLLNKRTRLFPRDNGKQKVCIAGLMETKVKTPQALYEVIGYGNHVRSTGSTGANADSSRSHAILQMELRDHHNKKHGRMSFIDLAGSERAADVTEYDRQTRLEGAEINQSLLALKECIRSLDQDSKHTPFRQSKLTHILKESFVGNAQMCIIANIAPGHSDCEHTLNTLQYASRFKDLKGQRAPVTPNNDKMDEAGPHREETRTLITPRSSSPIPHASEKVLEKQNIEAQFAIGPSLFHPSLIPFSSTPIMKRSRSMQDNNEGMKPFDFSQILGDPHETPVRGHRIRHLKLASRKTVTKTNDNVNTAVDGRDENTLPKTVVINHRFDKTNLPSGGSSEQQNQLQDAVVTINKHSSSRKQLFNTMKPSNKRSESPVNQQNMEFSSYFKPLNSVQNSRNINVEPSPANKTQETVTKPETTRMEISITDNNMKQTNRLMGDSGKSHPKSESKKKHLVDDHVELLTQLENVMSKAKAALHRSGTTTADLLKEINDQPLSSPERPSIESRSPDPVRKSVGVNQKSAIDHEKVKTVKDGLRHSKCKNGERIDNEFCHHVDQDNLKDNIILKGSPHGSRINLLNSNSSEDQTCDSAHMKHSVKNPAVDFLKNNRGFSDLLASPSNVRKTGPVFKQVIQSPNTCGSGMTIHLNYKQDISMDDRLSDTKSQVKLKTSINVSPHVSMKETVDADALDCIPTKDNASSVTHHVSKPTTPVIKEKFSDGTSMFLHPVAKNSFTPIIKEVVSGSEVDSISGGVPYRQLHPNKQSISQGADLENHSSLLHTRQLSQKNHKQEINVNDNKHEDGKSKPFLKSENKLRQSKAKQDSRTYSHVHASGDDASGDIKPLVSLYSENMKTSKSSNPSLLPQRENHPGVTIASVSDMACTSENNQQTVAPSRSLDSGLGMRMSSHGKTAACGVAMEGTDIQRHDDTLSAVTSLSSCSTSSSASSSSMSMDSSASSSGIIRSSKQSVGDGSVVKKVKKNVSFDSSCIKVDETDHPGVDVMKENVAQGPINDSELTAPSVNNWMNSDDGDQLQGESMKNEIKERAHDQSVNNVAISLGISHGSSSTHQLSTNSKTVNPQQSDQTNSSHSSFSKSNTNRSNAAHRSDNSQESNTDNLTPKVLKQDDIQYNDAATSPFSLCRNTVNDKYNFFQSGNCQSNLGSEIKGKLLPLELCSNTREDGDLISFTDIPQENNADSKQTIQISPLKNENKCDKTDSILDEPLPTSSDPVRLIQSTQKDASCNKKSLNPALITEKLNTSCVDVVFSPIHPQPCTPIKPHNDNNILMRGFAPEESILWENQVGMKWLAEPAFDKSMVTSTPMVKHHVADKEVITRERKDDFLDCSKSALEKAQELVINTHEEQLSEITALCKQEMQILRAVKSAKMTFEEYESELAGLVTSKAQKVAMFLSHMQDFASYSKTAQLASQPKK